MIAPMIYKNFLVSVTLSRAIQTFDINTGKKLFSKSDNSQIPYISQNNFTNILDDIINEIYKEFNVNLKQYKIDQLLDFLDNLNKIIKDNVIYKYKKNNKPKSYSILKPYLTQSFKYSKIDT